MKLRINEKETPNIEVKNKGVLEVPEGKNVDDLPLSHFVKLANKKGLSKITKALNNLQVWNKNDDPKLSKWAGDMIDKLNKKLKKDESVSVRDMRAITNSDRAMDYLTKIQSNERNLSNFTPYERKAALRNTRKYVKYINDEIKDTLPIMQQEEDDYNNYFLQNDLDESLIIKESNNLYDYIDEMGFSYWGHRFGYKIHNEMTADNIFVLSDNERTAKEYGEWLADIYKNYDEETIEDELNEFDYIVSRSKSDVIVTNPEYWKDERKTDGVYIVYEYDNFDIAYIVQIIGTWSGRF